MYISIEQMDKALNLGFKVTQCPDKGTIATRANFRIWDVREGYMTAYLSDGMYQDHKKYDSFEGAINRTIEEIRYIDKLLGVNKP